MDSEGRMPAGTVIKALLVSLVVLAVGCLGVYALAEGIRSGRGVHFAQAFMLLLIASFGVNALGRFWLAYFGRRS